MIIRNNNSTHGALSNIERIKNKQHESNFKRYSIDERRLFFAKAHQKNVNFQKSKFEKMMSGSVPTPKLQSSAEKSQINSLEDPLNRDLIPIRVQRVLLELHAKSRVNLSKSESILNKSILRK
jgi:hypothetical protein